MKSLTLKHIATFIGLSIFVALLLGILKISWMLNISATLDADKNFLSRLIVSLPYCSSAALLISFAFYMDEKTSLIEIVLNFIIVLILCFTVFEVIYTKAPKIPDEVFNAELTPAQALEPIKNYANLKRKVNKTLDIIYYTGDFKKAYDYIKGLTENESSGPSFLVAELMEKIKERESFEERLIQRGKNLDPDFDKGYAYLRAGKLFNAERYFRNNLNEVNRYFLNKSSDLLRRRGEKDLEEKFQNTRRKKQLTNLGSLVEKKYQEDAAKCYSYYNDIYSIYGSFGLTDKYFKYSRLISISKITANELDIIKARKKATNLIYLTSVKYTQDNTSKVLKQALVFIKVAYYLEGSQRVYLKDIILVDNKNKVFRIDIARLDKNIGITKNLTLPDGKKVENSYITLSEDVKNILEYRGLNFAFEKLSILRLAGISYKNPAFMHFKLILAEKVNYYLGFFIVFLLSFTLGILLKKRKEKIKGVLGILPVLLTFVLAFFIFSASYFLSGKIIYLIL